MEANHENKLVPLFCYIRNKSLLCIKFEAYVSKKSQTNDDI